jgi:MOSC domain-containing protein YiiM
MKFGKVIGIYIAHQLGDETFCVESAHVVPGFGIEGDRHFSYTLDKDGTLKTGREITLIEMEAIEYIRENDGIKITPNQTRRNIITRGIALNDLVGHEFLIGNIKLRGVRLCEPCHYLANRTDPRIINALLHRGGLRADILTEGFININDDISSG